VHLILWKTSDKAQEAADALGITAHRLKALGLVDKIVNKPVGGAHRDTKQAAAFLKRALSDAYRQISDLKVKELVDRRLRALTKLRPLYRYQGCREVKARPCCMTQSFDQAMRAFEPALPCGAGLQRWRRFVGLAGGLCPPMAAAR